MENNNIDIKNIKLLSELRAACKALGLKEVSDKTGISCDRISSLCDSKNDDSNNIDFIINVKNIKLLAELRLANKVFGTGGLSKRTGVPSDRINSLCCSNIPNSIEINFMFESQESFKTNFKEHIKKAKATPSAEKLPVKAPEFLKNKSANDQETLLKKSKDEKVKVVEEVEVVEDYDDFEDCDFYENKAVKKALFKNERLIDDLKNKRLDFAGIGTNKAKRRLNKLAKESSFAKAVRIALEIEDKNISAKNSFWKYKDKIYHQKTNLILSLSDIFDNEKWVYGIQNSDCFSTNHIIYFEIPGCEQISWHFSAPDNRTFPNYNKPWDGKENSTLRKLENVVCDILKDNSKS